ncbi:response regulator transcription factor [Paenibacillus sp. F411]|uniref:response regulator transcription factor n=1 Tax=unclassified Paenibacillus TaxID=185978 RepID=UPI001AAFEED2|nr:response regulator transcription factor [Paenibacillus sp. F411]MBO2945698.1 response regulator transcription factor [Paenibacillus sp. F411]
MEEKRYRVILVDDEPIILRSLRAAIPWEELSMEVAGEAKNGEAALELVKQLQPHVLISDIRMPGLDGISLMKEVMQEQPKLFFIFISGYGEFEYAREALREGAFDYLLKPIDHEELAASLLRAVAALKKQEENDRLLHSMQTLSLLARERLFTELIEGSRSPLLQLQWLEHNELDQSWYMAVLQLDRFEKLEAAWSRDEKRLWLFAIRNILEEWFENSGGLTVFPFRSGEWLLIFPERMKELQKQLGHELISLIKRHTKLSASVGFSLTASGMQQLGEAYESATRALYQRFYTNGEGVYCAEQNSRISTSAGSSYPKNLEASLLDRVRTLDQEGLRSGLQEVYAYLEAQGCLRPAAEQILVELSVVLYRQFKDMRTGQEWSLEELLQDIHASDSLKDMMSVLQITLARWMKDSAAEPSREDMHTVMEKARSYIQEHYQKDLSIEEVSEYSHLSISHFCTLFKQSSGYTFVEYLTLCRIEKAKHILRNTSVKVYQVAPLVGYQDPRYFTQVFKKVTGHTPTEYRESVSAQ